MIEVRPMKAEDMLRVISKGIKEMPLKSEPTEELRQTALEREREGRAFSGWVDGEVVGVGGIDVLWKGCANAWLMLTPYINEHLKEGYKCILEGMRKVISENNIRRMQSYGRVDFPACHILFKHLGFKVEGLAKKYTPDGCDCIMYGRVSDG